MYVVPVSSTIDEPQAIREDSGSGTNARSVTAGRSKLASAVPASRTSSGPSPVRR
jgi:hypothetical protein